MKPASQRERIAAWAVRIAFAAVFAMNVACALQFVVAPEAYEAAYGLSGPEGAVAVRGMGVAFLMWNATYPPLIASPQRFEAFGWVILAQQAIGLAGEGAILATLGPGMGVLAASIGRFAAFDAVGLVAMAVAFGAFLAVRRRARADA